MKPAAAKRFRNPTPTRERLIAATIDQLKELGPGVTLDQICKVALCVRPALYQVFPSREAMIGACLRMEVGQTQALIDNLVVIVPLNPTSLGDHLRAFVKDVLAAVANRKSAVGLSAVILLGTREGEVHRAASNATAEIREHFARRMSPAQNFQLGEAVDDFMGKIYMSAFTKCVFPEARAEASVLDAAVDSFLGTLEGVATRAANQVSERV